MKERPSQLRSLLDMLVTFLLVCALFVGFRYFIRFPVVNGDSMQPTYRDGDRLAVLYTKNLEANDIAVVWSRNLEEYIVKRVVGVPGDMIAIKDGRLYRNGIMLLEFYIREEHWKADDRTVVLQDGQYFLLGDNRNHSTDSRSFGTVPSDDIFGRVILRLQRE